MLGKSCNRSAHRGSCKSDSRQCAAKRYIQNCMRTMHMIRKVEATDVQDPRRPNGNIP